MRDLMRRIKWVVIGLFALVVALGVAAYAIIANYPVEDLKALIQDEVRKATGRELAIDGALEMQVLPSPAIVMEGVHLANADWANTKDMLALGRVEAEVAFWPLIGGDIEVRRLVLRDAVVALERDAEGRGNWELGQANGSAASGSIPRFSDVLLENWQVSLDDSVLGTPHELQLAALRGGLRGDSSSLEMTMNGALDARPFELKLLMPEPRALTGQVLPLEAAGTFAEASFRLKGQLAPPETGSNDFTLALEGPELRAFDSALPPGPFTLDVTVKQNDAESVALPALKGRLGGADFDGALTLSLAGTVPRIEGKLHLGKLALPAGAPAQDSAGLFPAEPLPFELLRLADADLVLTIDELSFGARTLTSLAAHIALESGKLAVDPLGFAEGSGTFNGALQVDASSELPTTRLRLSGSGLPLGPMTDGLLNGSAALDLDLAAKGESPKALAASLSGRSEFSAADGTIDSSLTTMASAPLAAILRPLMGGSSGQARLNCLVNRMDWKNGLGTNQGTALDAEGFTVVGNGTVDLRSEIIDFYVDTWSKDTALVGLAVPMRVTGPLAKPQVAPDPAGTALGIAKTAGLIVFPPAGLAAIIGDRAITQDGNPCVVAVEKVEEGGGASSFFEDVGTAIGDTVDSVGKGAGDVIDTIGEGAGDAIEGLKGLFSN